MSLYIEFPSPSPSGGGSGGGGGSTTLPTTVYIQGGDSGLYLTPANIKYLRITMTAGGGGGGGTGGIGATNGTNGGDTTFGTRLRCSGALGGEATGGEGGYRGNANILPPGPGGFQGVITGYAIDGGIGGSSLPGIANYQVIGGGGGSLGIWRRGNDRKSVGKWHSSIVL